MQQRSILRQPANKHTLAAPVAATSDALTTACEKDDLEALDELAVGGSVDLSAEGSTRPPLCTAARHGSAMIIDVLVHKYGVDVMCADNLGHSAIHHAARRGQAKALEALIACGAHIDPDAEGFTPLVMAVRNHANDPMSRCVHVLIRAADSDGPLTAKPPKGSTPHEPIKIARDSVDCRSFALLAVALRRCERSQEPLPPPELCVDLNEDELAAATEHSVLLTVCSLRTRTPLCTRALVEPHSCAACCRHSRTPSLRIRSRASTRSAASRRRVTRRHREWLASIAPRLNACAMRRR